MNQPLDLKGPVARIAKAPAPEKADPAFSRLRKALRNAGASGGDSAARILAPVAELIDAEAIALAVDRDGALAISDITLDSRHRDIRTKVAAELRLAASEALRGKGSYAERSTSLPGSVCIASAFADGTGAVAALRADGAEIAKARATLELAAHALQPARVGRETAAVAAFATLVKRLEREMPADPVELAALLQSAFEARQSVVCAHDGALLAIAPESPTRRESAGESAIRDLIARAEGAEIPIVERSADSPDSVAAMLKADLVVALHLRAPRNGSRLVCLLVEPRSAFVDLDKEGWLVVQALLDAVARAPTRGRARAQRWIGSIGALCAAILVALAMFIPIADRIRAEGELEPEGRHFVTATFNAVLRHADVAPGDVISRGDRIATLEGEELFLSRSAAAARADEAFRRRDAAVRAKRVTEAELARLEGEAASAERDLLDWQIAQLDLKSPVDGMILVSPFEHSGGAPVREGDVIAEIAPIDRLRVRIDVPVEDLDRLAAAKEGMLYLDGVSGEPVVLAGFSRAARAEAIGGRTVIPLRTTIDNPGIGLRPGQKGVVLLPTGTARVGEILFRNAWTAFRRWTL